MWRMKSSSAQMGVSCLQLYCVFRDHDYWSHEQHVGKTSQPCQFVLLPLYICLFCIITCFHVRGGITLTPRSTCETFTVYIHTHTIHILACPCGLLTELPSPLAFLRIHMNCFKLFLCPGVLYPLLSSAWIVWTNISDQLMWCRGCKLSLTSWSCKNWCNTWLLLLLIIINIIIVLTLKA